MKSIAFNAVFGIVPGYNHDNYTVKKVNGLDMLIPVDLNIAQIVAGIWQEYMEEEFKESNILVTAVCTISHTVYPVAFGCPKGGEFTVSVDGCINPIVAKNNYSYASKDYVFTLMGTDYIEAVKRICLKVKDKLEQATVSISFHEIDSFVYLSGNKT